MKELLTITEASEYTGLSESDLMLAFHRGLVKTENVGGTLLFFTESLSEAPRRPVAEVSAPDVPTCPDCGFTAKSEAGLATHARRKHGG